MARRGNYKILEKFSWYIPGIGGMFALLGWLLVGTLIGALLTVPLYFFAGKEAMSLYGTVISYPVMFIPPMLYAAAKSSTASMSQPGLKLDSRHFSPVGGVLCAIIAAVGTIGLSFWSDALTSLLPPMPDGLKDMMQSLTNGNIWINLLCVSIMAPICEEWLCRGMVLRGLLGRGMKPALAICISALFFAVIHMNPWQAVPAFAAGCLFGYVYYKTGSLRLTMLMHCANNTFAIVCSRIPAWENMESFKDVFAPAPYAILLAASVILTALCVLAFRKVRQVREGANIDPVPSIFESNEV